MVDLAIGVLGLVLILSAFLLEEFHKHTRYESLAYNTINLVGAFFLGWYAWTLNSWPFLVLNVVWMAIAAFKLVEISAGSRSRRSRKS